MPVDKANPNKSHRHNGFILIECKEHSVLHKLYVAIYYYRKNPTEQTERVLDRAFAECNFFFEGGSPSCL